MKASLLLLSLLSPLTAHASSVILDPTSDFFTTAWAFGAPYVHDTGRDHLGISAINPFEMGTDWEETTYLTFDLSSIAASGPVTSAILTFTTVQRSGIPVEDGGITVSAHHLLSDPSNIDPSLSGSSENPNNYVTFKDTQIGGVVSSVFINSFSTYTLDLTELVNEWLTNGDANYAYATALTGRVGNDENPDAWVGIVNGGYEGSPFLTITIPEVGSTLLGAMGSLLLLSRRRA